MHGVVAEYESISKADSAVHILQRAGLPADQISLIAATLEGYPSAVDDLAIEDDSIHNAVIGAGLGGILGILTGVSLMTISGLGIVFLLGPIGGGFVGAVTGGFVGALSGWGIHRSHLAHYERSLKQGCALVIAEGDPLDIARADRILQEPDNKELHIHAKTDSESARGS